MKTISQVLKKAKLNDILTDGKRYWKVIDTNYDYHITVATPVTKTGKPSKNGFELWSSGIEKVAVIPGLRVVK